MSILFSVTDQLNGVKVSKNGVTRFSILIQLQVLIFYVHNYQRAHTNHTQVDYFYLVTINSFGKTLEATCNSPKTGGLWAGKPGLRFPFQDYGQRLVSLSLAKMSQPLY